MTKNQKYTEYQDSGLEWLGDIPNHWEIKKLVWFFSAEKGKNGQLLTKEYCGLNTGEFPVYSGQTENNGIMGSINSYEFDVGDNGVLFSTTVGAKAMTLSYLQGKFSLSQNCMIIKPRKNNINTRFYYYHCQPLFAKERALIPEHMQASFRVEDLYSYRISLPPIIEQVQIANFLDHETSKIDSLIEKQQKLIELLKEKRQAVISHAVTKGLNSNVPMKDSGVEWLGQVPEHWIISGFKKYLESIVDYRGKTPEKVDEGVFLVTARNIKNGQIDYALSQEFVAKKDYEQIMSRGKPILKDVLFTTEAPLGEVAQIDNVDIALAQRIIKFRGKENVLDNTYLKYFIISQQFQDSLMTFATGSTALGIKAERLGYLKIAIPPLIEQYKIVEYIEIYLLKNKSLIQKAQSAIQLMQERRTALISAAVTGKIDVRNWQNPNNNNEAKTEFSA